MDFLSAIRLISIGFLIWRFSKADFTKWDDTPPPIKEPKANLDLRPILKSYYLLQISYDTELGLEDVEIAYQRKLAEIAEIRKGGFTPMHDLPQIECARAVLIDYYWYAAFRN